MATFTIKTKSGFSLQSNRLLIAEPFMQDPEFTRSVVFLCNHEESGSFGLTINQKTEHSIEDFLPEIKNISFPVFSGGPVETNTLFVLHNHPDILQGEEVAPHVYLGADFDALVNVLEHSPKSLTQIKFFLGYSGWGAKQLNNELDQEAWIVCPSEAQIIYSEDEPQIYKNSLKLLGDDFSSIALLPKHPSLN
jgi:putative transcriptional regulator